MASKHAKLKLALTRAIIDFFLQEDLYADELKIQGTLCVTADRSAIFVTQITETVNDAADGGTLLPSRNLKKSNSLYSEPHRVYGVNNVAADCPEDLTCNSGRRRLVERQPPAAHTKHNTPLLYKSPLSCLTSPKPTTSRGNKPEPWPLSLNKTNNDVQDGLSCVGAPGLNTPGLSLLENSENRSDKFFSINSAILNAAAKSAIERLTSLSRENEQLQTVCATNTLDWNQDGSGKVSTSTQPQTEVIDCSSAKKRRLDVPCLLEIGTQLDSALTVVTPHSNDLDIPQGGHLVIDDQPLMLVTPKRERISDDEGDGAENGYEGGSRSVGTNSITKNSNTSASCESSPKDGQTKLHSPPSTTTGQQAAGGCLSPWSFSTANMKEEPSSVPDWSGADWMRKPRTKFSQEQLKALETEYKNDPFLSTSADKRAELARRLNITEKNVQIWFQNQRRRRRAAAYSHMHYTLNDAPGDKPHDFTTNHVDNADPTMGSPEFISDHDGENSTNCTPGRDGEHDMDIVRKHEAPRRVSYEASLDDSNSSDLIIATDFSLKDSEAKENHEQDSSEGHSKGQHKSQVKSLNEGKSKGDSDAQGQDEGEGQGECQDVGQGQNEIEGDSEGQSADKVPPDSETETKNAGSSSPDSPQPTSPKGPSGSDGSDVHEMNGGDA